MSCDYKNGDYRSCDSKKSKALIFIYVISLIFSTASIAESSPKSLDSNMGVELQNNPFVPPLAIVNLQGKIKSEINVVSAENLELRAILFSKKNPLVNLNGEIVAVGEEVQGYRVDKVFESHIELSKKQQVYRVELLDEDPA